MEFSLLIAKIISVIYISAGIGVLIGTINLNNMVTDLKNSVALTYIAGSVGIILGMILIEYHNIWVKNWTVSITIISWLLLIGGVTIVIFPNSLSFGKDLLLNHRLIGIFMIAFGIVFGYFGFIK